MDGAAFAVVLAVAIAVAAFVQGFGGFGFGIAAMSILALFPVGLERAAAAVNVVGVGTMVVLLKLSHEHGPIQWRQASLILVGALVGQPLGYAFILQMGNQPVFRVALGAFLVLAGVNGLLMPKPKRKTREWVAVPAGLLGGLLGGAFGTGGPPIVMYLYSLHDDPRSMKATVQLVFLATLFNRLLLIQFMGPGFTGATGRASLVSLPVAMVMLYVGHRLCRRVSTRHFMQFVYSCIAVLGGLIAGKATFTWMAH